MHLLNDGIHACVFPPRCGTRWIAEQLYELKMIDTKGPHHHMILEEKGDVKILMFVRNPFFRERSLYRWLSETSQIDSNIMTFEDYTNSYFFEQHLGYSDTYQDNINLVDEFIPMKDIVPRLNNLLKINLPEYDFGYHIKNDNQDDIQIYRDNTDLIDKVLEKYKNDLDLVDFNLTMFKDYYII